MDTVRGILEYLIARYGRPAVVGGGTSVVTLLLGVYVVWAFATHSVVTAFALVTIAPVAGVALGLFVAVLVTSIYNSILGAVDSIVPERKQKDDEGE